MGIFGKKTETSTTAMPRMARKTSVEKTDIVKEQ
jgi:hypothetical protein